MAQSLGLTLDESSPEPLYRQIFDQIVTRVRSGTFPPGYRLPPTRALADQLGAHRNTVVRAYADLEAAGFVHSTVGRGTFVAPQPTVRPGTGAPGTPPAPASTMPWSSLVSRIADAEPLSRFDRLRIGVGVGADVVNLSRMQPASDLMPEDLLQRCIDHVLRTQGAKVLGYVPRDGLLRLRGLIAEDLARQGVPAAAENILITTGSQQALDLIARTLINPGDPFLVDEATYTGAINLLTAAGARLIPVPSDDEGPDLAALERVARPGVKGFYLMPGCNNPTTSRVSPARREALVVWAQRMGIPLIEDDYASDLELTDRPPPPAMRALDGDVIYTGTFSKKLMPALRIGFVVCPAALRPRMLALKHTMDLGTSLLLQHALAEFMERGYLRAHLNRIVPEYRRRCQVLEHGLKKALPSSWRWRSPEAGLQVWLPLPDAIPPDLLFEEAQRQGVLVSPSTLNAVETQPRGGVRLIFATEPTERLAEGARRLGKAVSAILGRLGRQVGAEQGAGAALGGI
jgi:GntR family transcriptional regulator/MocR family aminotransferase